MAQGDSVTHFPCANQKAGLAACQKEGKFACKPCRLVAYCGRECQKSHWEDHKKDCKSPLLKDSWIPAWEVEERVPAFIGGPYMARFGGKKYLWGNMPAFDLLNLKCNEGAAYNGDLCLLFAASGDPRNVIKTIVSLPKTYNSSIRLTINDWDFNIVARNAIILLVALTTQDRKQATECMIHIWYSALVPKRYIDLLRTNVRPLVEGVWEKIQNKSTKTPLAKTWTFGSRSLRLVLPKEGWMRLLSYFEVPNGLSTSRAQEIRTAITMAPERQDYRDRRIAALPPAHRVCEIQFRKDGIFLPFGHPRDEWNEPNPTFFQAPDKWPMKDNSEPFDGWNAAEVLKSSSGPAINDKYGKLYYYVLDLVSSFYDRISSLNVGFEIHNTDAREVATRLTDGTFARIEVSNITDSGYVGIAPVLSHLGPLLQEPAVNRHATLVTLFMNAVDEALIIMGDPDCAVLTREMKLLRPYMPMIRPLRSKYDTQLSMCNAGRLLVRDVDKFFDRYMEVHDFRRAEQAFRMSMNKKNTIIPQWPTKLKLRPGQEGAQEEFDILAASAHAGVERYVEWKRTPGS